MYGDHIAGKIDPALRVANRPVTAGYDQEGGGSRTGSGAGARQPAEEQNADGTSSKRDRSHSNNRSQASRSKKGASQMSQRSKITTQSDKPVSQKFDISPECKL